MTSALTLNDMQNESDNRENGVLFAMLTSPKFIAIGTSLICKPSGEAT